MRCSRLLLILLSAAGCTKGICSRNSECAPGFVCSTYGTCVIPPDASTDTTGEAGVTTTDDAAVMTQVPDAMSELPDDGDI